jgi:hypothetical protein
MMELERMETVPSFDRNSIMYTPKLGDHSFDDIQAKAKTALKNELTSSYGIDARVVELDLYDEDDSEDEGEIMLLAMILLQLHGKFPGGFPDPDQDQDQDSNNKKKRQRTSPDQLAILEQIFQTDKMPSQQTRVQLADQLGMSSRRVQIWFQNKRAKVKRGLGKSSDGFQIPSPSDLDNGLSSLSSSSCLSEPSSPVPDSCSPSSPSSSPSPLCNTPPSPSSAVVPSSPSLPNTPRIQISSQAAQLQFSLSSLAQPIFSSEFSSMASLIRP